MNPRTRIYVAGGATVLGKALIEQLQDSRKHRLVGVPPEEPDLTHRGQVEAFFAQTRPEVVIVAAGLSGGIYANQSHPADLMLDNMLVSTHVLSMAFRRAVKKLLYLGSSCMYPRRAPQPLRPEALGTGPLEPTSEAYATAKLAGMKLCQAYRQQYGAPFIVGIPANGFGPHDDFSPDMGHVIPALMRRMHDAKLRGQESVEIWGTGTPRREFLFVRDLADACLFVLDHYNGFEPINLGSGQDLSIADIARLIADVVGYQGRLHFDTARPDGMPRKSLDSSVLLGLGWRPVTDIRAALASTYVWFAQQQRTKESHDVCAPV